MRSTSSLAASPRRRLLLLAVGAGAIAVVAGGALIWLLWFSSQAPAAASLDGAIGAVESSQPSSAASPAASETPGATDDSASFAPTDGVDGTWTVDTSIGSFSDYTSAFAGFRVDEVLTSIGSTTAVGRTPDVSGLLTIADGVLVTATIEVDLTTIRSDQSRRDPAIQRALETGSFATATFTLTGLVTLPDDAAAGATVTTSVAGDLTIHGVTMPVTLDLEASIAGGVIVVVGAIDVTFTDFGVDMPTAPIVASVEEAGQIEFQLFFSRT